MQPPPQPQMSAFQAPVAPMPPPQNEPEPRPKGSSDGPGADGNVNIPDDSDVAKNNSDTEEGITDRASGTGPITTPEIDNMLNDVEDIDPVTSIMDNGNHDEPDDDINIEDLPDPDPVPTMYSPNASSGSKQQKSGIGKIIVIFIGIFLIAILAALFFARGIVMDLLPVTKAIYETIGLSDKVGAGLSLSKPKLDYGTEEDTPILVVQGVITNVSEDTRPVPMLKVILRDSNKKDIQTKVAPPVRNELPVGERMRYKITVVKPSPRARSIAVIFSKPEDLKAK